MINYLIQKFDETRLWHFIARNVLSHFTLRFSGYPAFDWQRLPELLKIISNAEDDADNLYAFVLRAIFYHSDLSPSIAAKFCVGFSTLTLARVVVGAA